MNERQPQAPETYRVETSAAPSRFLLIPVVIGVILHFVPLTDLSIRQHATLTLILILPLLSFVPLWRLTTKQIVEVTDTEIVVTNVGKRGTEVIEISLDRVSDIRSAGRAVVRQVLFVLESQVASVSVQTGDGRRWFGWCMRADAALELAKEIRRRAYRLQGGARKPVAEAV